MKKFKSLKILGLLATIALSLIIAQPAFAVSGSIGQVESFIKNIIQVVAGLAGLIATGFFVIGGFGYITSSGNPEHLDKAKRTLLYSAIGLTITIGAFVLSNIITDIATKAFGS